MKKIRAILAVLIVMGMVMVKGSVAQAAENGVTVVPVGNRSVEVLAEEELAGLSLEMSPGIIGGTVNEPLASNSSYTAYRYSESFNFYFEGNWVARADAECIVWHYTDGKVHLYQRTIGVSRLTYYDAARVYGSIVNTDGSYSYTTGDRVHLYLDEGTCTYAIDFYVSATEGYFNCYRV